MRDMCPAFILNISIDFQSWIILELFPAFKSSTFQSFEGYKMYFSHTPVYLNFVQILVKIKWPFSNFDKIRYSSNDPKITMVTLIEWSPNDFMESDNIISGQFIQTYNLIKVSRWLWTIVYGNLKKSSYSIQYSFKV